MLVAQPVVLVCAPAGCGKSALLARAIGELPPGHAAVWISLDAGDDLQRLLECAVAALEPHDPPWRTAPEGLISKAVAAADGAASAVVGEVVNTLEVCEVEHGVIVLDDLHHLADPAALGFLDLWLERLGERWTIVLSARHEPGLRLGRLRARGQLAELREADLRFERDEARALLAAGGIEPPLIDALVERSEGWAAGLRLAVNGARGGAGAGAIDRPAFDFLATEVLDRIDPALRRFLLLTSVLHELDAERCAALIGEGDVARWLDDIERLGLFASVVAEAPRTLRLHDLFRDALAHRLRVEQGDERRTLLERAAATEADPLRQQALLLEAGNLEEAARQLLEHESRLLVQGAAPTLLRLVGQFPPAFAERSAELQRVAGTAKWSLWKAREAESHFALAEALFAVRGASDATLACRALHAITLIGLGRLHDAAAALSTLEPAALRGEARRVCSVAATWHALEAGRHHHVARAFEDLVQTLEGEATLEPWFNTVPPPRQTSCRGIAPTLMRWTQGVLDRVGERPLPMRALAYLTLGWTALWQGRLDEARGWLDRAEADAQWTGHQVIARSHSLALRGVLQALSGEPAAALQTMRVRIAEYGMGYGWWGLWHHEFLGGRIATVCGAVDTLRRHLDRLNELRSRLVDADERRLQPVLGLEGTCAWLEGRADDAVALWRRALADEEACDLLGQAAELHLRLAHALWLRHEPEAAAQHVEAATVRRSALDVGDDRPCGALFARAALHTLADVDWNGFLDVSALQALREWARALPRQTGQNAISTAADASSCAAGAPWPAAALGGLTAREFEVLSHMANGHSNKVIARTLELSPFTVKRHVAHILDKLDVASRKQAAEWFHERAGSASSA